MPAAPGHYAEGPEALIVSLASRGDRDAFAELVRRRQSWVRNLLRRFCGDANQADDLSQQVFLKAWRKIRQLRDANRFGTWLRQIAVNEWLQVRRRVDPLQGANDADDARLATFDSGNIAIDLDKALSTLPEPVALCIVLSYYERMTHEEIAAATGIKLGTVKSHIRRGSERLREALSAYVEPEPKRSLEGSEHD